MDEATDAAAHATADYVKEPAMPEQPSNKIRVAFYMVTGLPGGIEPGYELLPNIVLEETSKLTATWRSPVTLVFELADLALIVPGGMDFFAAYFPESVEQLQNIFTEQKLSDALDGVKVFDYGFEVSWGTGVNRISIPIVNEYAATWGQFGSAIHQVREYGVKQLAHGLELQQRGKIAAATESMSRGVEGMAVMGLQMAQRTSEAEAATAAKKATRQKKSAKRS